MTNKEALKIARECVRKQAKPLAPSANMIIGHVNPPGGMVNEAKRYRELMQAMTILDGMIQQGSMDL